MERKSSNNEVERKRSSVRLSKNELLKDVPPVAVLSLHGVSTYSIENEADVVCFTKGFKPDDLWINKADDEIALGTPLLSEGLIVAVKNFCDSLPHVYFESFGTGAKINKRLNAILYRSVCELVKNARKHASPTNIFVQVMMDNDFISVTVYDDGKGLDLQQTVVGAGLGNIATAVIACKGKMKIHSSSKGTEIHLEIEQ